MKRRYRIILIIMIAASLVSGAGVLALTTPTVDWWVFSGGGGNVSDGDANLNSTVGQPFTGKSSGGDVSLGSGYWAGIQSEPRFIYLPLVLR